MIVKPKMRGFICTTAHPVGCAENTRQQADYIKSKGSIQGPKRALVIGSSTGYGMACRLTAAFGCGADTVGVFFEKPAAKGRPATAGWYNNKAFEEMAGAAGLRAYSVNGDAYSDQVKEQVLELVRQLDGGQVDLVVYSLAAPRRTDAKTGAVYNSVIKPIGQPFSGTTIDIHTGTLSPAEIGPATQQEIDDTVKVMGGEDWLSWIKALDEAGALAKNVCTLAFSYIGPEQTHAIYKNGTIGRAKEDLEAKAGEIDALLRPLGGKAYVSVNKGLVTQASAAIPVVPLYISLLYQVMQEKGTHEDCTAQMVRMFRRLYAGAPGDWSAVEVDEAGRIRMDDWEMLPEVQEEIARRWALINQDNVEAVADLTGYREDFYRLFGFGLPGVDYNAEVEL